MNIFQSAFGKLTLHRWPLRKNEQLQAWDAADEHLLNHLSTNNLLSPTTKSRILIVNDAHGALSCALHSHSVVNWSDSFISQAAAVHNWNQNNNDSSLQLVKSTDELDGSFDLVLIRVPKANALLEYQLNKLRPHITRDTVIVAAGMIKHLQRAAFASIENMIGPITTSLAVKKSRLIFSRYENSEHTEICPYPSQYNDPDVGIPMINHANVFSRDHLDHGTRFFLSMFNQLEFANRVVDLACGNGVLGIKYQLLFPHAKLEFIDESYMAVDSTRTNHHAAFQKTDPSATFFAQDGLTSKSADSCDLVLCNPPFHVQHTIGDQVAIGMFTDARRCLTPGGSLWVVANHHLVYKSRLTRIFGQCRIVAKNQKFVILHATKR